MFLQQEEQGWSLTPGALRETEHFTGQFPSWPTQLRALGGTKPDDPHPIIPLSVSSVTDKGLDEESKDQIREN